MVRIGWVGLTALAAGCLPRTNLEVLQPAEVALPSHIDRIAVIDRSRPSNFGQGVLGTLEGIITGEDIQADRQAAKDTVREMANTLGASPRYEVVVPPFDRKGQDSSLFDRELSADHVRRICQSHRCQGVVSLEAFDSDNRIDVTRTTRTETNDRGREVNRVVFEARRDTDVLVAWRVYDAESGTIVDDVRDVGYANSWSGEGRTEQDAINALPSTYDAATIVGREAGVAYAMRIAPTYVWVSRAWFGGGSDEMKAAKQEAKAGRWDEAAELWRRVQASSGDPDLAAKATFNLAVYHELDGRLDEALKLAQDASVRLSRGITRDYVNTLRRRLDDARRLEAQMEGR